jgi:hypothetical protein
VVRLDLLSPILRRQHFYEVEIAGRMVGLRRSKSYEAANLGLIPTVRNGRKLLVPKQKWDRKVQRLMRDAT